MQQNQPEINFIRPPRKANPVQVLQLEQPAVQHGQFKQLPPRPSSPVRKASPGLTSPGLTGSAFPSSTLISSNLQRPSVQKGSFSISVFDNHGGSYDIRNGNNNSGVNKNGSGARFPNFQNQYGLVLHIQSY